MGYICAVAKHNYEAQTRCYSCTSHHQSRGALTSPQQVTLQLHTERVFFIDLQVVYFIVQIQIYELGHHLFMKVQTLDKWCCDSCLAGVLDSGASNICMSSVLGGSKMTSLFSYFRHRYDKIKGDTVHSHPKESEIRLKLKKELYQYNQVNTSICLLLSWFAWCTGIAIASLLELVCGK